MSLRLPVLAALLLFGAASSLAGDEGRIDAAQVEAAMSAHAADFKSCYEQERAKRPKLKGRIDTRFTVAADGRVSAAEVTGSTLKSPAVESCVLDRIKAIEAFPAPVGGPARVSYPFTFEPTRLKSPGKATGYRFTKVVPGSIYDRMGLRAGDVVLAIDGEPVRSGPQLRGLVERVKRSEKVRLKIKRGAEIQDFEYKIDAK